MNGIAFVHWTRCARAALIQSALLALLTIVSSCSQEQTRLEFENPSPTASGAATAVPADPPLPDHEPVPHSTVVVRWRDAADMNGAVLAASSGISGELRNASKKVATGRLVLVTAGLDSRKVERELERFTLAAEGIGETSVQVGKLPIQSDAAPSFAALVAEIDGPKSPIRVSSAPLYYRFEKGYNAAVVYNAGSLAAQSDWGLKTDNPMDVQGRIIETDGRITDAAPLARRAADEGMSRKEGPRGFSTLHRAPVDPNTGKVVLPKKPFEMSSRSPANFQAPGEFPPSFWVCSNWLVQYTDTGPAGQKEDYFATDQWAFQPARYASFHIFDAWWNVVWEGNLESGGCAWVQVPTAGDYALIHWTNNTQRDGKVFHALYPSGGTHWASGAGQWFNVSESTGFVWLSPGQNDDPIQVTAVTGQILYQDAVTPHGLGIPVRDFQIHTNTGCPFFEPFTDSCFLDPVHEGGPTGTTLIGTTEIAGVPTAHWKYITAHELGHHVQFAALGTLAGFYDQNASEALCKCDYDLSWGNTEHCIQSREQGVAAQVEAFAQMFASRVFNNPSQGDTTLVYYKPIAWDGNWLDPSWPPSPVDVLGQYRWRDTHCPAVDMGVELDWMAFFYALTMEYSSDSVPMSDLTGLYRHACGAGNPTNCQNAATTWGFLNFWKNSFWANNSDAINYWNSLANAHGVVN